jgi:hypothetical protein
LAGFPLIRGPKATAVGSQEFINEKEVAFIVRAKLKLCVRQDDARFFGMLLCRGVK